MINKNKKTAFERREEELLLKIVGAFETPRYFKEFINDSKQGDEFCGFGLREEIIEGFSSEEDPAQIIQNSYDFFTHPKILENHIQYNQRFSLKHELNLNSSLRRRPRRKESVEIRKFGRDETGFEPIKREDYEVIIPLSNDLYTLLVEAKAFTDNKRGKDALIAQGRDIYLSRRF